MNNNKKDEVEIEGHRYDGITEFDNPLPTWWLWTFYITIIFAFIYYVHYELGGGPTLKEELNVAMAQIEKTQVAAPQVLETEEALAAAMKDESLLKVGAATFASKCAACHGPEMQGLIGPNLTDKYWIHGKGTRVDMVKVIREGVADKGMPAWGPSMKKEEIYGVAAYILSKVGSNPANAKAPQGELVQ